MFSRRKKTNPLFLHFLPIKSPDLPVLFPSLHSSTATLLGSWSSPAPRVSSLTNLRKTSSAPITPCLYGSSPEGRGLRRRAPRPSQSGDGSEGFRFSVGEVKCGTSVLRPDNWGLSVRGLFSQIRSTPDRGIRVSTRPRLYPNRGLEVDRRYGKGGGEWRMVPEGHYFPGSSRISHKRPFRCQEGCIVIHKYTITPPTNSNFMRCYP